MNTEPTQIIRIQLSERAYSRLASMASLPRQHASSNARGLGWWLDHQLTHNNFVDSRPQHLQQAQQQRAHKNLKNLGYWIPQQTPRKPRDLKISQRAIIRAVHICNVLDISPYRNTPNAYVGALLEAWGLGHLSATNQALLQVHNPEVNQTNRARRAKYAIENQALSHDNVLRAIHRD